jgi:hypothetical protein
MDIDIDIDPLDTFTGTFTGPLTKLRARSTALPTPVVSASNVTPSYRLVTTLVPIYTSAPSQSVPTPSLLPPSEFSSTNTAIEELLATTTLEPVSIAPLASLYFPQATHPHWVPSEDDVPVAWRPHFEQDERVAWISFMGVGVVIFFLAIVGVVGGSVVL